MWPILGNVFEEPNLEVFLVGVFYGLETPRRVQSYLDRFMDEYARLMETGCTINGHKLTVEHRAFIFDSPARSFCKGVVSFNATCGCIKCLAERGKNPVTGVITYQVEEAAPRTDAAFRTLKEYVGHHQEGPVLVAARNYLRKFVEGYYKETNTITSNIHLLTHVVDEVDRFGPLPTISTYSFENCLGQLKRKIKSCRRPLEQIANRVQERALSEEVRDCGSLPLQSSNPFEDMLQNLATKVDFNRTTNPLQQFTQGLWRREAMYADAETLDAEC
ncbi:uncharacterized protein LOC131207591 [Anopheles bellator]|uniref:uncharacterized protein LOC131207591 n=1 Tax=Anopheles bellator TaxID=139047 RepID=UPI002647C28B|nr:uncharacterized protein LOC131207591 [Anopheles bellator]